MILNQDIENLNKRIQELNLNAILNVSYLFLILIKSISKPIEAVRFSIKK